MVRYAGEQIFEQANTNVNKNAWGSILYNVKAYGAKGDGIADDSPKIGNALAAILSSGAGGTIYFPPGDYRMSSRIDIDLSSYTVGSGSGISIKGDNGNTTTITNATVGDFVFHITGVHFGNLHMENITFVGLDLNTQKGIHFSFNSEQYLENLTFTNLHIGIQMEDVVRCKFVSCTFSQNNNGLVGNNQIDESTPNAIDLFGCVFYGNAQAGAYFEGGCNVNFFGGTVETNGHGSTPAQRYGVRLENMGRYGGAAASFFGTYFEGNSNIADVWINHNQYPATYSFHGCTFNKFAPPLDNVHNIRVDAQAILGNSAPAKVLVTGSAFRDMGNTPSSSTKYIGFYTGGTPIILEQYANYFQSQVELPEATTNHVYASARITNLSTTPALFRGFNIDTIVKNGTGDYTINFIFPSVVAQKTYSCSMDIVGFTQCAIAESTTSVRVKTYNASSVLADPGTLWLICLE